MTMIAYAFLQHRRLAQAGSEKKESMDLRLSQACQQYATQSSTSFFDRQLSGAHTANEESVKSSAAK